jgi:hypothetical protein
LTQLGVHWKGTIVKSTQKQKLKNIIIIIIIIISSTSNKHKQTDNEIYISSHHFDGLSNESKPTTATNGSRCIGSIGM